MRLGLSQTLPISHAFFNGLYAASVPCTDECSDQFQLHFANWIGYCINEASWRTGTNTEHQYLGSDPIVIFMGLNQKLLFTTWWKLCKCESVARKKIWFLQCSMAHWKIYFEPMREAITLLCHHWVLSTPLRVGGVGPFTICILHSAIKWVCMGFFSGWWCAPVELHWQTMFSSQG